MQLYANKLDNMNNMDKYLKRQIIKSHKKKQKINCSTDITEIEFSVKQNKTPCPQRGPR